MLRKQILLKIFLLFFLILLVSCQNQAISSTPTIEPSLSITEPLTQYPTLTPFPLSPIPLTIVPSETPQPQFPPTVSVSLTPLGKFPLDGYVLLFKKEGDLYFQDGENTPIKLTYIGENVPTPMISDDNQKVVFFREESGYSTIYSINTDGSNEKIIVTDRPLPEFLNQQNAQVFVPNTHQLLFNTYNNCEGQNKETRCAIGLSLVDTDTGEIKQLVAPSERGQYTFNGNFKVSPNGNLIAIKYIGYVDLININGKVIHSKIFPYIPKTPNDFFTYDLFPEIFWVSNSNELIAGLPNILKHTTAYGDVPACTIWNYQIDTRMMRELPLDPHPTNYSGSCDRFQISQNGEWILYGGGAGYDSDIYIGDLVNQHTQTYGYQLNPNFSWSPDSRYFLFSNKLGTINQSPVVINAIQPLEWIDSIHFTYFEVSPNIPYADTQVFIAELSDEGISTYELEIPLVDLEVIKLK